MTYFNCLLKTFGVVWAVCLQMQLTTDFYVPIKRLNIISC